MCNKEQYKTPIFTSLKDIYAANNILPFHVPGHKQGKGIASEFIDYVGENIFKIDVTLLDMVDGLHSPKSHIKEALRLCAKTYGAQTSFFSVNGTSGAIQAMIMSVLRSGEKIIVPRNIHASVYAGIILSGAIPIYIQPEIDHDNGISHGVSPNSVKKSLQDNPDAAAVLIINPTYYGVSTNLEDIVSIVHSYDLPLLVDEAHGPHLKFSNQLPISAMEAGADACAQSTHKILGALTQASMLHINSHRIDSQKVRQTLNLLQTTSPSYLLLASLDLARKQMATKGEELMTATIKQAQWLREEINKISGLHCFGSEILDGQGIDALDLTKITISAKGLGITGQKFEQLLLEQHSIQVELSDFYNVLLVITYADSQYDLITLVKALHKIADENNSDSVHPPSFSHFPSLPEVQQCPRSAYFADKQAVPITKSCGYISGEFVMAYPPGIPILCPGEIISQEIINYIEDLLVANLSVQGLQDTNTKWINTLQPLPEKTTPLSPVHELPSTQTPTPSVISK